MADTVTSEVVLADRRLVRGGDCLSRSIGPNSEPSRLKPGR